MRKLNLRIIHLGVNDKENEKLTYSVEFLFLDHG